MLRRFYNLKREFKPVDLDKEMKSVNDTPAFRNDMNAHYYAIKYKDLFRKSPEKAFNFIERGLIKKKFQPNQILFNALITFSAKKGRIQQAFSFFKMANIFI